MPHAIDLDAYGCLVELVAHAQVVSQLRSPEQLVSKMVACSVEFLVLDANCLFSLDMELFAKQIAKHQIQVVLIAGPSEESMLPASLAHLPIVNQTSELLSVLTDGRTWRVDSNSDSQVTIPPKLTRRERQVWRLIAVGQSVAEVASTLGLAESTIDSHKSNLMKKLNVRKSVDLVRLAFRFGVVEL
ncbi:helix-turn-helix transcriptional regulator [Aeoliella mucimassa]|nr:LuxR family transcriptional regulator [Aeoliella mucimassa]